MKHLRHLVKKYKGAPQSPEACNTTHQLKEWRKGALAFVKEFVPKIAQKAAEKAIKREYEANKARIKMEKTAVTTTAPGPTSNATTTLTTGAPESAANQTAVAASKGALRLAAGSAGQGGEPAGARAGAPSSADLLAAGEAGGMGARSLAGAGIAAAAIGALAYRVAGTRRWGAARHDLDAHLLQP